MLFKLCDKRMLPIGDFRAFKVKGVEVLAVNLGGEVFCLDGRCTHAGAPLAEGILDGEILTCPWHYSQFNIKNGQILRGPAYKTLKTYKVEIKENILYVDL
jgi:nitrite reductase/ring-hydroxylating ferredoxin subunit